MKLNNDKIMEIVKLYTPRTITLNLLRMPVVGLTFNNQSAISRKRSAEVCNLLLCNFNYYEDIVKEWARWEELDDLFE